MFKMFSIFKKYILSLARINNFL